MHRTTALAAALLSSGIAFGVNATGAASAAEIGAPAGQTAHAATPAGFEEEKTCYGEHVADIPDGRSGTTGGIGWWDYNWGGYDQDKIYINDGVLDGTSSSLWVRNNYTGETDYVHVYSGKSVCLDVGALPNRESVTYKACGWDDGEVLACTHGVIEE